MKIPSHESDLCYFFTSYVDTDSIKLYEFSNIVRNCNDVCSKTDFICLPSIALIFWMQYFEWIHNDHTLFRSSVWLKNINEKYKKKKANLLCTGGLLKCYVAFDSYWTCCWNVMLPLTVTGHVVEMLCCLWQLLDMLKAYAEFEIDEVNGEALDLHNRIDLHDNRVFALQVRTSYDIPVLSELILIKR